MGKTTTMATGDYHNDGNRVTTMTRTMKAAALRATKLTMMETTMTMVMGDDNDDGDGWTSDCAMGYDKDDDGDG